MTDYGAGQERLRGWFWWTKRNERFAPLTLKEFFFGEQKKGRAENTLSSLYVPLRLAISTLLVFAATALVYTVTIVVLDRSVTDRRCERMYWLWPMGIANCANLAFFLCSYSTILNRDWFKGWVVCEIMILVVLVSLFLSKWQNMRAECTDFYNILYPRLYQSLLVCGWCNSLLLFCLLLERCFVCCFDEIVTEDFAMSTTVFWKHDEEWVPPLFEAPQVKTYKEGVQKWGRTLEARAGQLQATLDRAEDIRKASENQSKLLQQVSNLVSETENKVTKTSEMIKDQEKIISDFKKDFEVVQTQLQELPSSREVGFTDCTKADLCLWAVLAGMVLTIVTCVNTGWPILAHLLGFSLVSPVVAEAPAH